MIPSHKLGDLTAAQEIELAEAQFQVELNLSNRLDDIEDSYREKVRGAKTERDVSQSLAEAEHREMVNRLTIRRLSMQLAAYAEPEEML